MAQGEVGEFGESLSFYHLAARIIHPNAKNANANLTNANFLLISLSYLGIELACEVPDRSGPKAGAWPNPTPADFTGYSYTTYETRDHRYCRQSAPVWRTR